MDNARPFSALYAYNLLDLKKAGSSVDRIGRTLFGSKIKLTPHQIQAALFAFKSPISKGVVLADEVGLGKTIEAGIVLAQLWFERKRKIIVVAPASLMKQWQNELEEKFGLPSMIMDRKSYMQGIRKGYTNPFVVRDLIIICSYQTCSNYKDEIFTAGFDYAVIDEAHKLRNVHNEKAITANNVKYALSNTKKMLLTATPIQNSLMDLYGLSSVIDDSLFGDKSVFRYSYIKNYDDSYQDLISRLEPFLHRTLRKQVNQYIKFTNRIPRTFSFHQTKAEQEIYNAIHDLLLNADRIKYIIPERQKHLLLLILSKLMGSSVHSIVSTLSVMKSRLERIRDTGENESVTSIDDLDLEDFQEEDEFEGQDDSQIDFEALNNEISILTTIIEKAKQVDVESKYIALQNALLYAFDHLRELGAEEKVIIFTESVRTQDYLYQSLKKDGYEGVLVYNGSNKDSDTKEIYNKWLSKPENRDKITQNKALNLREAIIDSFKGDGRILIATEAGAEGLNLQFCSLVINYDLPWNPQRVEQRIGRCHRFGQQFDVVVINFINEDNAIEQRIYELLSTKFRLFDEVLGSSDSILGSMEDGAEIAKSIIDIYTQCRSVEEINEAFDDLQSQFRDDIDKAIEQTKNDLLENFDEDLQNYFADVIDSAEKSISDIEKTFWRLSKCVLPDASFDDSKYSFVFNGVAYAFHPSNGEIKYTTQSELGQKVLAQASQIPYIEGKVIFDISNYQYNISTISALQGKHGFLSLRKLVIDSFETDEQLVINGVLDDGTIIDEDTCDKLFRLCTVETVGTVLRNASTEYLYQNSDLLVQRFLRENAETNNQYLTNQIALIDKWAEDKIQGTQLAVEIMREQRKELQKMVDLSDNIQEKEELEEKIVRITQRIKKSWIDLATAEEDIEEQRKKMISQLRKEAEKGHRVDDIMLIEFEVC